MLFLLLSCLLSSLDIVKSIHCSLTMYLKGERRCKSKKRLGKAHNLKKKEFLKNILPERCLNHDLPGKKSVSCFLDLLLLDDETGLTGFVGGPFPNDPSSYEEKENFGSHLAETAFESAVGDLAA